MSCEEHVDVVAAFLEAANRFPDSPAVVSAPDGSVSYCEVERRSAKLAGQLLELGLAEGEPVALLVGRSASIAVSILGVLRSGCSYVPIEPEQPDVRVEELLAASRAKVLVVDAGTQRRLDFDGVVVELRSRDGDNENATAPQDGVDRNVSGSAPAYTIFTSGSSGAPRGVLISRTGLSASTHARFRYFGKGRASALLSVTYAFDSSVAPIFHTLCSGGTLVVSDDSARRDVDALSELIDRHRIDYLYINPNIWRMLLGISDISRLQSLCAAVVCGEACSSGVVRAHFDALPKVRLVNEYGPTEATVWATVYECDAVDEDRASVPIGRAIEGYEVIVLDNAMAPTAPGDVGEIYIGGPGLAIGYLDDPVATNERFVAHPADGRRLYRTGDLAIELPDGNLEFRGRVDSQVKIRGYRVEPSEIEALIGTIVGVRDVAVVAVQRAGSLQLGAHVQLAEGVSLQAARASLEAIAPSHLVPTLWNQVDRVPRTDRQKVDRQRLPAFSTQGASKGLAANPDEETLMRLFAETLGLETVGVTDDFFGLGGDSIRAIQLRNRANRAGLKISIANVFENTTPRALANTLDKRTPDSDASSVPPPFSLLENDPDEAFQQEFEDAYPASRLQTAMLMANIRKKGDTFYLDSTSVSVRAPLNLEHLQHALDLLVQEHPALRTSFLVGASLVQRVHRHVTLPIEVGDASPSKEHAYGAAKEWVAEQLKRSFDLCEAPLVRLAVHPSSDGMFQLSWVFHHAVVDGLSNVKFAGRLFEHYSALVAGARLKVVAANRSMVDFIGRERNAVHDHDAQAFWSCRLDGAEPPATRRASRTGLNHRTDFTIADALCRRIEEFALQEEVPVKSVLLIAHLRTIAALYSDRALTGVVGHGRPDSMEGSRAVGLFLNVLPIRASNASGTWREAVHRVWNEERAWQKHRAFPADAVRELVGWDALFDTAFNYTDYHVADGIGDDSEMEVLSVEFDGRHDLPLSLSVSRSAGQGIGLAVHGDGGLFSELTRRRVFEAFVDVLERLTTDPDARCEGPVLGASPRPVTGPTRNDRHVLSIIFEQADRNPEGTAIVDPNVESVNYGALRQRVERVASHLWKRLSGLSEPTVCVLGAPSGDLITAMLAVWRAGGVYVPLSTDWPAERIQNVLLQVQPQCTLVCGDPSVDAEVLRNQALSVAELLHANEAEGRHGGCEAPFPTVAKDDLAYVLYTSGSTGRPKGVAVGHAALANHICWRNEVFPLAPRRSRMLFKATPTFDISLWEVLAPLTSGAAVVPWCGPINIEALADRLVEQRVTDIHATPALLGALCEEPKLRSAPIERVFVGGSELSAATAEFFVKHYPTAELIHQYGPTETTIDVLFHPVQSRDVGGKIPLGRAIRATTVAVCNDAGSRLPAGFVGEMRVSGSSLARGYYDDPRATALRFVPDASSLESGSRCYRSGDMARASDDGALYFVGRLDRQTKIRGQRLDPEEVEALASSFPGVSEAAVVPFAGNEALRVAVAAPEGVDVSALVAWMREYLSDVFVPREVTVLERFPHGTTGKIDRRSLWAEVDRKRAGSLEQGPLSETAQKVLQLANAVLGRENIPIDQDLFVLGANSITLIHLSTAVEEEFGVTLDLEALFATPTVEQVAIAIDKRNDIDKLNDEGCVTDVDSMSVDDLDRYLLELVPSEDAKESKPIAPRVFVSPQETEYE